MALEPSCALLARLHGADSLASHWVCCDSNTTASTAAVPPAALIASSDPDSRSGISVNGCIPPTSGAVSPGNAIGIFGAPTSSIPAEFFSARNLNKLTVYSTLQGSVDLTRATTLTYLKLYRNNIAQLSNGSFSASSNLRYLIAPKNGLTGEFPASILEKGLLEVLNLTDNKLEGTLPSNLAQRLPRLTTLDLSLNRFKGPVPNLADMKDLEVLDVSNNDFTEFPPTLPPKLRTLRIANNPNAHVGFPIKPTKQLQDVYVSGNSALSIRFDLGEYALKSLTATAGVKVHFHPKAVVATGTSFDCMVDLDQACIIDMSPGTKAGRDAGDVGPSGKGVGGTGRVVDQPMALTPASSSSSRTLAAMCDVRKYCSGEKGPNLTEPESSGSESGSASATEIALRASALSVSMCAVVVILVYGGRQWFKYRKRRRRAAQRYTEAYDMSTSMSIASKPGQPQPPMGPSPPSQVQQLHSQTQSSTIISSPHLHTGTTLVYPMPTAPGAPAVFATVPSPSMQWYPTTSPGHLVSQSGGASVMSPPPPPPPPPTAGLPTTFVAVPPPPPPGHVYIQSTTMPLHPQAPIPQAYFPSPSSRPSTPTNPPRLSTSLSSASNASVLSPAARPSDAAADAIIHHDRRASTASSLFGSVRTTKLPPSPPTKPTYVDLTKYAYDFAFGDHQSEKSRRSKLLTSAWVRDHALPASVASPTTSSGMLVSTDTSSPSVVPSVTLPPTSADTHHHLGSLAPAAAAAHHHLGPIATSSPTSASPSTDWPLAAGAPDRRGLTPPPALQAATAAAAAAESLAGKFPRDPFAARVVHSHEPDMGDEIALVPGDAVWVESVFVDGWGAGTNLTRNVQGVFPLVCIVPEVGVDVSDDTGVKRELGVKEEREYFPPPTSELSVSVGGPGYAHENDVQQLPPRSVLAATSSAMSSPRVSSPQTSNPLRPNSLLNPLRARLPHAPTRHSPPHSRMSSPTTPTPSSSIPNPSVTLPSPLTTPTQSSVRPSTAPQAATPKHAIQASRAAVPRIVTQGLSAHLPSAAAGPGVRRSRSAGELVMAATIGLTSPSATWPPPTGGWGEAEEEDEVATVVLAAGDREVGEEECLARWKVRQGAMGQLVDGHDAGGR